jgi:peptidoglycan/xylan/chitin deacetylase (PgdA/CDA1 family)
MALLSALATVGGLLGVAGLAYAAACRREGRRGRILALLYHRLVTDQQHREMTPPMERRFSIPERVFRAQMHYLRDHGYHPVSSEAVRDHLEGGAPMPEKPVLITFDDGCESVHSRALPILQEFGFPALFFVTTSPDAPVFHSGNAAQRQVTPDEIRDLDAAGVAIGSHGVTHEALAVMAEAEIEYELGESKRILEEILGKPVDAFGVPLNWYGRKVRAAAQRLGYRTVYTSDCGCIHADSDPFHLRRLSVDGHAGLDEFVRNLAGGAIVRRRLASLAKRMPSRLLGPRIWMPLREKLFASPLRHLLPPGVLERVLLAGLAGTVVAVGLALYLLLSQVGG